MIKANAVGIDIIFRNLLNFSVNI